MEGIALAAGAAIIGLAGRLAHSPVSYVRSDVDGNRYLVRKASDMQLAADTLARMHAKVELLIAGLHSRYPENTIVVNIRRRYTREALSEGAHNSGYTSYSVDKGRQIVMCLRDRAGDNSLHQENLLFFVLLHELAHLSTDEQGHTPGFWDNFRFLREEATKMGLYEDIDYRSAPAEYCGITIRST
jgi:hypothetical protein